VAEPLPPTVVSERWRAALADAGIAAEDVAFWPCEGFDLLAEPAPACTFPAVRSFVDERFEPALERAGYDLDRRCAHAWRSTRTSMTRAKTTAPTRSRCSTA
jgi:hypothetical protein